MESTRVHSVLKKRDGVGKKNPPLMLVQNSELTSRVKTGVQLVCIQLISITYVVEVVGEVDVVGVVVVVGVVLVVAVVVVVALQIVKKR